MTRQFLVVSYDISDDKRRRKVMQALEDFGSRVQYSVFECRLSPAEVEKLKKRLKPYVREAADSIRFYFIGADDVGRTVIFGGGQVSEEKKYYLIGKTRP
jgi:CRISPR-associated protein Cas2